MKNKTLISILTISLIVFLTLGCNKKKAEPLYIGTNTWPGYEALYLSVDLGYNTSENLSKCLVKYG